MRLATKTNAILNKDGGMFETNMNTCELKN